MLKCRKTAYAGKLDVPRRNLKTQVIPGSKPNVAVGRASISDGHPDRTSTSLLGPKRYGKIEGTEAQSID
jgi:hypothetical protein